MGLGLPSPSAMAGLLVGTRRGLFYVAPISLLGVIGLFSPAPLAEAATPRWLGPDPVLRVGAFALIALYLANAGYYMWWGGSAAGPRHLVPALPVLGFGLARLWQRPRARAPIAIVGALSIAIMLGVTAVGIEAPETGDVIFDFVLPRLSRGEISSLPSATNLGLLLGLSPIASLVPWLLWLIVLGTVLWRRTAAAESAS